MIVFSNVYPETDAVIDFLYNLLLKRDPAVSISHRKMPTLAEHRHFVQSRPYQEWYLITVGDHFAGAIYLTKQNEIGIHISEAYQAKGYGERAIRLLMELHPTERFLANIAPGNERSVFLFEKLGFELCQLTFELRKPND